MRKGFSICTIFTTDKGAAKQAVLRTGAAGETALFDAISVLAPEIGPRAGKKAFIIFTDGADNASPLNARAGRPALEEIRRAGLRHRRRGCLENQGAAQ